MKKCSFILLILLFWTCQPEDCVMPESEDGWVQYTCQEGSFSSDPKVVHQFNGTPHGKWNIKFTESWTCYTLDPVGENHDWMKIVGSSFHRWSSNKDNVMLGARWLPDQEGINVPDPCMGKLQTTFYLNINNTRYDPWSPEVHDYWPVVEIDLENLDDVLTFEYTTTGQTVSMQITYQGEEYKKTLQHSGVGDYWKTISLWCGGTSQPVQDLTIWRQCIEF